MQGGTTKLIFFFHYLPKKRHNKEKYSSLRKEVD